MSRDPIEETGGENLYGFVGNDGVNKLDLLGLEVKVGDREAMLNVIHSGAMAEHKLAEDEYIKLLNSGSPLVKDPNRLNGKPFKPTKPREHGGLVCEKCKIEANGNKTYSYRLTKTIGPWPAGSVVYVYARPPDGSTYCAEDELEVGQWHTHPSTLGSQTINRNAPPEKRKYKYYWNGGISFSGGTGEERGDKESYVSKFWNPLGVPIYVTYREGNSSYKWKYRTDQFSGNTSPVRISEEKEPEWITLPEEVRP